MEYLQAHAWLLAPLIFFARIADVSLGTVRTILIVRGLKRTAAAIGFFEVCIWLLAAGQVLPHLDRWYLVIAYAGGFATGNVVGIWLEARLALGNELVRAISTEARAPLAKRLREAGHSVIEVPARGDDNESVEVLLVVEPRRRVPALLARILREDPEAVCTLSDVRRHVPQPDRTLRAPKSGQGPTKMK
jgi:uncharacterized protein YebE (UPF0316 family)